MISVWNSRVTRASILLATTVGCGPGAAEYARLRTHANEVLEAARVADNAWRAGVAASITQPPSGSCNQSVVVLGRERVENFVETQLARLADSHTAHFARVNSWVRTHDLYFDGHIKLKQDDLDRMHRELAEFTPYPYEIVMVERSSVRPTVTGASFSGGSFDGRLVVWNVAAQRVECAADVSPGVVPNEVTGGANAVYGAMVSASTSQAWQRAGLGERPHVGSAVSYRQ